MTRKTMIDFATATLPVVTGCSRDGNKGCDNCYAAFQAATRLKHLPHYVGLAGFDKNGIAQWTGKVRCNADVPEEPLRTKKPQRYFIAPRGDLFHAQVPDDFLDKVFAVMALCPQHTFLIFTKRAERRRDYLLSRNGMGNAQLCLAINEIPANLGNRHGALSMPLPNVWQITSVWDQESANRLIPPTLETPAAVRGVSLAPMLGPVDLRDFIRNINWVIVEGESGKAARPMHPDWVRSIRDQCAAAGVPFYFKQWGEWLPTSGIDVYCHGPDRKRKYPTSDGLCWLRDGRIIYRDYSVEEHARRVASGKAHNSAAVIIDKDAFNDTARVLEDDERELDNPLGLEWMYRVGKAKAGRLLDGAEHLEMPK
ncbi:MAG: phage Gp37/Gp68 family protein [Alphaproteobacteria bacterium]|nr:phage Gp37/Gp68 family protein [Alphaproteobacteria bacterium]